MPLYADSNYSFNPWMRDVLPQMQPDLGVIEATEAEEMVEVMVSQTPPPPPAPIQPRFGAVKSALTVEDVLRVGAYEGLRVNETGQAGTLRPALGHL